MFFGASDRTGRINFKLQNDLCRSTISAVLDIRSVVKGKVCWI